MVTDFKVSEFESPAFPGPETTELGLTKREYFYAAAMQGLLAKMGSNDKLDCSKLASDAVLCAEALIERIEEGTY